MRQFIAALVLVFAFCSANTQIMLVGGRPHGPAITCSLPDAFSVDDISTCWVNDNGGGAWSYDSTNLEEDYSNRAAFDVGILRWGTALAGANGHAKVTLKNWSASNFMVFGVIFRAQAAYTGSDVKYEVGIRADGGRMWWKLITGATATDIAHDEGCGTWASGDTLGIDWTGTGASTAINVWHNPTGAYGTWGAASCTFANCGLTCADTGNYVGLAADESGDVANGTYDDFDAASP